VTDSATFTTPEAGDEDLGDLLLEVLPGDGTTIGNLSAREALSRVAVEIKAPKDECRRNASKKSIHPIHNPTFNHIETNHQWIRRTVNINSSRVPADIHGTAAVRPSDINRSDHHSSRIAARHRCRNIRLRGRRHNQRQSNSSR